MRWIPHLLAQVAGLFLLSGCLFEHPVSEKPTRIIDEALLGVWDGSNGSKLTIVRSDAEHYKIEVESVSGEVEITINLVGHHAAVGGKDVVWLRWTPPEQNDRKRTPRWLPCAYDLDDESRLHLAILNAEKLPLIRQLGVSIGKNKDAAAALTDYYKVAIPRDDFFHPIPTRYTKRDKEAEQNGTGQPATRSESK